MFSVSFKRRKMMAISLNRTKALKIVKPFLTTGYFDLMVKLYDVTPEIRGCQRMFTPLQIFEIITLYVLHKGNDIPKKIVSSAIREIIKSPEEFKKIILKLSHEKVSDKKLIDLFSSDDEMCFYNDKKKRFYWFLINPYKVNEFYKILIFELDRIEIISVNKMVKMTEKVYGTGLRGSGLLSSVSDESLLFPYETFELKSA